MSGQVLQAVWGELLGVQSSQDDRHPPSDALSQVRVTDVKPAGTVRVSFHTHLQLCRNPLPDTAGAKHGLAPGPNALASPGFAQPHSVTPRACSKQHPPRSSDVSTIHREASSPHPEEQEGEFPPGSDRLPR